MVPFLTHLDPVNHFNILQNPERGREAGEVGAGEEGARGEAEGGDRGEAPSAGGAGEAEAGGVLAEDAGEGAQEAADGRAQGAGATFVSLSPPGGGRGTSAL